MTRLLITAANSDISIGIARILKEALPHVGLVGLAPDGLWPGGCFFDEIIDVPFVKDSISYKKVLEEIIYKQDIQVVCPISEKELSFFASQDYRPIKNILINPKHVIETFLDKYKTYLWLRSIHVPVPETVLLRDEYREEMGKYIIKPRASAGSKNMYLVERRDFFEAIQHKHKESMDHFVMQRAVGSMDDEYTCALWRVKEDYRSFIFKRKLQGGLTGEAQVIQNEEISKVLKKIETHLLGDFFINVQLRIEHGMPFIFEINPRFSSTIVMRHKLGFKDVLWSFLAMLDKAIPVYHPPSVGTQVFRMSEELIIPPKQ